jgi:hypothetical protein
MILGRYAGVNEQQQGLTALLATWFINIMSSSL